MLYSLLLQPVRGVGNGEEISTHLMSSLALEILPIIVPLRENKSPQCTYLQKQ